VEGRGCRWTVGRVRCRVRMPGLMGPRVAWPRSASNAAQACAHGTPGRREVVQTRVGVPSSLSPSLYQCGTACVSLFSLFFFLFWGDRAAAHPTSVREGPKSLSAARVMHTHFAQTRLCCACDAPTLHKQERGTAPARPRAHRPTRAPAQPAERLSQPGVGRPCTQRSWLGTQASPCQGRAAVAQECPGLPSLRTCRVEDRRIGSNPFQEPNERPPARPALRHTHCNAIDTSCGAIICDTNLVTKQPITQVDEGPCGAEGKVFRLEGGATGAAAVPSRAPLSPLACARQSLSLASLPASLQCRCVCVCMCVCVC